MNIKAILYILSILLLSLVIVIIKPQMHKQAIITDSEYQFVEFQSPTVPAQTSTNNIDLKPVNNTGIDKVGVNNIVGSSTSQQYRNVAPKQQNVSAPIKQQTKSIAQKPQTTVQKTVQQVPQKTQSQAQPKSEDIPQPKSIQVKPQNLETSESKHILTEQEEIIAWNKWRSNLQNQVMMDSKVFAPLGTAFKFSFTVDKFGNMSNVKVWSLNPSYSSYAVKVIKPVLMSYRNKPILNFPEGTKRIIVNVDGGFVISKTSRYSSPSDYHDYEHVKR